MKYFSTNSPSKLVDAGSAILESFPKDKGLYLPEKYPHSIKTEQLNANESLAKIAETVLWPYFSEIPKAEFKRIAKEAFNFPCPLIKLTKDLFILELWHGPTLAFKDFGARFMSRVMAYYNKDYSSKLTILVATSGDTGGAVASGFFNVPGINVVILYPKGKVSPLQEMQLCTFGNNIKAISINGNFDDCQRLVKTAFLDSELNTHLRLSSANSINIARLLPQMIYYISTVVELGNCCFIVPSGNFGNICSAAIAKEMGLNITALEAATNQNKVVPVFLEKGYYKAQKAKQSLSNAMDVGDPSNFRRLDYIATEKNVSLDQIISASSITEEECVTAIKELYNKYDYVSDPHTAIAYALFKKKQPTSKTVLLSTAHPSKFLESIENILSIEIDVPTRLSSLREKEMKNIQLEPDFDKLKEYLLSS